MKYWLLALLFTASSLVRADIVIDITQSGNDVVATLSGTFDRSRLNRVSGSGYTQGSQIAGTQFLQRDGRIVFGSSTRGEAYRIGSSTRFSNGPLFLATTATGDFFAVELQVSPEPDSVYVPNGYVDGTPLSATSTFADTTITAMRLIPGTHQIGTLVGAIITINIEDPNPTYTVGGTVSGFRWSV